MSIMYYATDCNRSQTPKPKDNIHIILVMLYIFNCSKVDVYFVHTNNEAFAWINHKRNECYCQSQD